MQNLKLSRLVNVVQVVSNNPRDATLLDATSGFWRLLHPYLGLPPGLWPCHW